MTQICTRDIIKLLIERHSRDVCIPECKTGPTIFADICPRLDMIAFRRSWVHQNVYGYEVKVNRGDFIQDNKWRVYLDYCTDFYFVTPQGIIDKNELPPDVGLIVTSKNGGRLFTIKKAPTRKVDIPMSLLWYILICRSVILSQDRLGDTNEEYWRKWLEKEDSKKELGWRVSKKIRKLIEERIDKVDSDNIKLKETIHDLQAIRQFVIELGFKEENIHGGIQWQARRRIEELMNGIPIGTMNTIRETINGLEKIHRGIIEIQKDRGQG